MPRLTHIKEPFTLHKKYVVSLIVLILALGAVGLTAHTPVAAQPGMTITSPFIVGDTIPQHGCDDFMLNRANSTVIPFQVNGMTPGTAITVETYLREDIGAVRLHQYNRVSSTAQVASGTFYIIQYMGSNVGSAVYPLAGTAIQKYAFLNVYGSTWGAYTEMWYNCDTGLITDLHSASY